MGTLISPVIAPLASQWQFWAPKATGMRWSSMSSWIDRRAVNAGWTETSTAS
jgi:hypothetical protein